jgi:RNA polymerase sigma-70 factor (ECF subfamily)
MATAATHITVLHSATRTAMLLTETNDMTLSAAIREGNEQVFGDLFKQWYNPLCNYALRFTGNDADEAEELVQQVFLKIWEKRTQLPDVVSMKSYLYRAVHNTGLNHAEKQKRNVSLDSGVHLQVAHTREEALPGLRTKELEKAIADALEKLPAQCRRVFELSRFEELKYKEIAEVMNISVKTVENQMGKALRIMREQLTHYLPLIVAALFTHLFRNQ